jgi:SPP1 family predicted phage head-tail adaptor
VKSGNLRDRVSFERPSGTRDADGNTVQAWDPLFTVWADVLETLGREKVAAGAVASASMATVRVRVSSQTRSLTPADRALFRGAVWNIRSIVAVGRRNEMIELLCERGVAT